MADLTGEADSSLLLANPTPWMRSVSEAVAAWAPMPTRALDTLWDPRTCPADVLPYLAWAVRLPLWSEAWSVNKRRSVIAAWIEISRIRGTREAFRRCLEIVNATLVDWVVPPAICAPRASRTAAERDAYRAQFPEARVYLFAERAVRVGLLTVGRPWGGAARAPQASTAYLRRAYRAEYVDGGVTTPLHVHALSPEQFASGSFELDLPDTGRKLIPGVPWGGSRKAPLASTALDRVFRFTQGGGRPDLLWPGLTPFSLQPERVAQAHPLTARLTPGRPWGGARRVPLASIADQFVYQSIRLYDPNRSVKVSASKPGGWILGRSQLGTDRFRIDIVADTSYRAPGRRFMPGHVLRGTPTEHDPTRINDVCAALNAAKIGRDRVLLRTGLYRRVSAADNLPPTGAYTAGQIIRTDP
jgi:phage tail P2-like protein